MRARAHTHTHTHTHDSYLAFRSPCQTLSATLPCTQRWVGSRETECRPWKDKRFLLQPLAFSLDRAALESPESKQPWSVDFTPHWASLPQQLFLLSEFFQEYKLLLPSKTKPGRSQDTRG